MQFLANITQMGVNSAFVGDCFSAADEYTFGEPVGMYSSTSN